MARATLTVPGEDLTIGGEPGVFQADVIGTSTGGEVITLVGGTISLDPSFNIGGDTVDLNGNANTFTVQRSGSNAVIVGNGTTVTIPIGDAGLDVRFNDVTLVLRVSGGNPVLGNQVITTTAAPVNPAAAAQAAAELPSVAEIAAADHGLAALAAEGKHFAVDLQGGERAALAVDPAMVRQDFVF